MIVRLPFPFVEQDEDRVRPALIVSTRPLGLEGDLFWAVMITSLKGRPLWPGDIPVIDDHLRYGLPVPCLIRTEKVSTLSASKVERELGKLSANLFDQVRRRLAEQLAS